MTRPVVSVGIPVHNGAAHIQHTLESVLTQDYENLEVIVSDNASADDTEEICQQYVKRDPRVRYHRNDSNIGATANFARVLARAHGTYFTWLASDDFLVSPEYISRLATFMGQHHDVVLCASALHVLDYEGPGSATVKRFDEIDPSTDWRQARREFFTWPQRPAYYAIYGLYRRDALAGVSIIVRRRRDRFIVRDMEYPVLMPLASSGRIVALPEALRAYRFRLDSGFYRELDVLSPIDKWWLDLDTRWCILRAALATRLPLGEKAELVALALRNFSRGNVRRPTDYKTHIRELTAEVAMLRRVCSERLALIERLHAEIQRQRQPAIDGREPTSPPAGEAR